MPPKNKRNQPDKQFLFPTDPDDDAEVARVMSINNSRLQRRELALVNGPIEIDDDDERIGNRDDDDGGGMDVMPMDAADDHASDTSFSDILDRENIDWEADPLANEPVPIVTNAPAAAAAVAPSTQQSAAATLTEWDVNYLMEDLVEFNSIMIKHDYGAFLQERSYSTYNTEHFLLFNCLLNNKRVGSHFSNIARGLIDFGGKYKLKPCKEESDVCTAAPQFLIIGVHLATDDPNVKHKLLHAAVEDSVVGKNLTEMISDPRVFAVKGDGPLPKSPEQLSACLELRYYPTSKDGGYTFASVKPQDELLFNGHQNDSMVTVFRGRDPGDNQLRPLRHPRNTKGEYVFFYLLTKNFTDFIATWNTEPTSVLDTLLSREVNNFEIAYRALLVDNGGVEAMYVLL